MFWIFYTINAAILIYGISYHKFDVTMLSILFYVMITIWQADVKILKEYLDKLNQADKEDLILAGKKKAKEFKQLNWFQKIIYLTAFKAGAEYILRKLK